MLEKTRLMGPPGYPVVHIKQEVHRRRLAADTGPVEQFDDVARGLHQNPESFPESATRLLAFISTAPPSEAVKKLLGVRVYCRVIVMVPEADIPGEPLLSELDYQGITLASVRASRSDALCQPVDVVVHVAGDPGRRPGSDVAAAWARAREEQLYAQTLRELAGQTRGRV